MVERMRSGASSTVTGSMRRVRSALVVGAGCGVAVGICIWARAEVGARRREAPAWARVRLPSWMKCRRCKGFAPAGLLVQIVSCGDAGGKVGRGKWYARFWRAILLSGMEGFVLLTATSGVRGASI